MPETNAVVGVYENPSTAEEAVTKLQKSGFDAEKLSIGGEVRHGPQGGKFSSLCRRHRGRSNQCQRSSTNYTADRTLNTCGRAAGTSFRGPVKRCGKAGPPT
jgi:hypothetical protein